MSATTQNLKNFSLNLNIKTEIKEEPKHHDSITFEDYKFTENFDIKEEPHENFEIVEAIDEVQPIVKIPFSVKFENGCEEIYTKKLQIYSVIGDDIKNENKLEIEQKGMGNGSDVYENCGKIKENILNSRDSSEIDAKIDELFDQKTEKLSNSYQNVDEMNHNLKFSSDKHYISKNIPNNSKNVVKLVNHDHNYFTSKQILEYKSEDDSDDSEIGLSLSKVMFKEINYGRNANKNKIVWSEKIVVWPVNLKILKTPKIHPKYLQSNLNMIENNNKTSKIQQETSESTRKTKKILSKISNSKETSSELQQNESSSIFVDDSDESGNENFINGIKNKGDDKSEAMTGISDMLQDFSDDDLESLDEDENGIQYKEVTTGEMNTFVLKKRRLSSISEDLDIKSEQKSQLPNKIQQKSSESQPKPSKISRKFTSQRLAGNSNNTDQILKCPNCPMTFEDTLRLNRHKRLHVAPQHQCRNCLRKFKRKGMLKKHFCDIKCTTCTDNCTCAMETSNDCIICQKINFRYFVDYKQHMLSQHNEVVICKVCEKNNYTLFKHKQLGHLLTKFFRCTECTTVLKSREQLNYHMETHAKNFKCEKCGKIFSRRYLLKQHLLTHDNPNQFHCRICKKNFQRKYCLDNHNKVIHSDKKKEESYLKFRSDIYGEKSKDWLRCDKCPALFRNQQSHQRHLAQAHAVWDSLKTENVVK